MRTLVAALSLLLTGCSSEYLVYKDPGPGLTPYAEFNEEAEGKSGIVEFVGGERRDGYEFSAVGDSVNWREVSWREVAPNGSQNTRSLNKTLPATKIEAIHLTGAGRGAVEGAGSGLLAGLLTASILYHSHATSNPYNAVGVGAVGAVGMIIGSIVGATIGHEYIYRFNWKAGVK
jgi:hypothetical protein